MYWLDGTCGEGQRMRLSANLLDTGITAMLYSDIFIGKWPYRNGLNSGTEAQYHWSEHLPHLTCLCCIIEKEISTT